MEMLTSATSCLYLKQPATARADCRRIRTPVFTALALTAFASNSILCRTALGGAFIDAAGFTTLRLISGALMLWLLAASVGQKTPESTIGKGNYGSAVLLFAYAAAFSFAFLHLNTAAGALMLFGSVQATMFVAAIAEGQKPSMSEYLGLIMALAGLSYLVFPGLGAPTPWAAALMMTAGISWGLYSLRGRGSRHPIVDTRNNFLRTLPLVMLLGFAAYASLKFSIKGVLLAVISGGGASALGYVIWYAALQDLKAKPAALVQLAVPPLAAAGGVLFLSEPLTPRLIIAAVLILGGIALAVVYPARTKATSAEKTIAHPHEKHHGGK